MKHFTAPMEIKELDDTGSFDGYASIFGNVDLGGDVIERNAFTEMVKNEDGNVVVLWQHDTRTPIGVASVVQDDVGLKFKGKLILDDAAARKAHAHMKAKSVRGMSIGYDVLEGGARMLDSGIRSLVKLKLWEISLVTFGMNPMAGVADVKQALQITNIREFEEHLRDAGFSKEAAKILCRSYKDLPGQRDAVREASEIDTATTVQSMVSFLEGIAK